jgi:hypothetical protein
MAAIEPTRFTERLGGEVSFDMIGCRVLATLLLLIVGFAGPASAQPQTVEAHITAIMTRAEETPSNEGLLAIAIAEARTAAAHASMATQKPDDLAWMKRRTEEVLHAVDPSATAPGPGLEFGLLKAASGVADHMSLALNSLKATPSVKAHGPTVLAGAEGAVTRARAIMDLGLKVRAAGAPAMARPLVEEIERLTIAVLEGAEGDGGLLGAQRGGNLILKEDGLSGLD